MSALTQHPLSAIFPAMSERERKELAADIETHGQRHPCVVLDGQILDGWHRYQACLEAGRDPLLVEFEGGDPRAFVISQNAHRRHLTGSQRAALIVKVSKWAPAGNPNMAPGATLLGNEATNEEMAAAADTSPRTIRHAKKAEEAGLSQPVIDGKVSAKTAAAVADLPKKLREKVASKPAEDWVDELARKSPPKEEVVEKAAEAAEQIALDAERMVDLALELEELRRITDADDKLAEARLIIKEQRAKYEQLEKLYNTQRSELAEMTRAAKRHQRKAEALEKQLKGAA